MGLGKHSTLHTQHNINFRAIHDKRYFSHPDEVGERKFWFDPFGRGWALGSVLLGLRALTAVWP